MLTFLLHYLPQYWQVQGFTLNYLNYNAVWIVYKVIMARKKKTRRHNKLMLVYTVVEHFFITFRVHKYLVGNKNNYK